MNQERADSIDADQNVTYFFLKDYQEVCRYMGAIGYGSKGKVETVEKQVARELEIGRYCSLRTTVRGKQSTQFFETSGRNLLTAEAAAGVGHHVALSMTAVVDEIRMKLVGGGIPVPENSIDLDQSSVDMPPPPMMAPLKQLE